MTNRDLSYIVKDQNPLVLAADETVRGACRAMWERASGSVLVADERQRLCGIFTGRDALKLLARGGDAGATRLSQAMTRDPVTIPTTGTALDALRAMSEGGFRHVPVVEGGKVRGIVARSDLKGMELERFLRGKAEPNSERAGDRKLAEVVAGQKPLVVDATTTVQEVCEAMCRSSSGSALVVDEDQRLLGIFTGRDAVRLLARTGEAGASRVDRSMTRDPQTISGDSLPIDALHAMNDGGFRHLPVMTSKRLLGVVSRSDFVGMEIDRLDEEERLKEVIW